MNISSPSPLQSAFSTVSSYVRQDTRTSGNVLRSGVLAPVDQTEASAASQGAAARSPVSTDTATQANGSQEKNAKSSGKSDGSSKTSGGDNSDKSVTGQTLTPQQKEVVQKLQARDLEVRQHEAAHQAAGGSLAGAASFTYQRGPNGVEYAVGGDVPIQISQDPGNPQATIQHMEQVRAAALAPAQPSAQDRSVAAEASQILLKAQTELLKKRSEQFSSQASGSDAKASGNDAKASGQSGQGSAASESGQSSSNSASVIGIQAYKNVAGNTGSNNTSSSIAAFSASA